MRPMRPLVLPAPLAFRGAGAAFRYGWFRILLAALLDRDGPALREACAGAVARLGVAGWGIGTATRAAEVGAVGIQRKDEGTNPGCKAGAHFPLTVGAGKVESSGVGDGVAATRGVVEIPIDEPGHSHLMLSTRMGSPLQRSYNDR